MLGISLIQTVPVNTNISQGSYVCKICGEKHASDSTELWCTINENERNKKNNDDDGS